MLQVTISSETAAQLERRRLEIENQMAALSKEHDLVVRKLAAIPLFLADVNGASAVCTTPHGSVPKAAFPQGFRGNGMHSGPGRTSPRAGMLFALLRTLADGDGVSGAIRAAR